VTLKQHQEFILQSEQKPDFHDDLIKELLYWIEVNLSDRLTMEKASKKTGYSPWYLSDYLKAKRVMRWGNTSGTAV